MTYQDKKSSKPCLDYFPFKNPQPMKSMNKPDSTFDVRQITVVIRLFVNQYYNHLVVQVK